MNEQQPPVLVYTPRLKRVLALAACIATEINHSYVGSEHVLLAIFRINEGCAARMLAACGATEETARIALEETYNPMLPINKALSDLDSRMRILEKKAYQL